jgi:hypothetical protein
MKTAVRIILVLGALAVVGWLVSRFMGSDDEATESVLADVEEAAVEVAEELAEVPA